MSELPDEPTVNSPPTEQPTSPPSSTEPEMISISKEQYQELINSNLNALARTLNTLNDLDKIISSLNNMQGFVMNLKEDVKKQQLGLNKENAQ